MDALAQTLGARFKILYTEKITSDFSWKHRVRMRTKPNLGAEVGWSEVGMDHRCREGNGTNEL